MAPLAGTVSVGRAILGALQPLQGPAAAGSLLVRSTGATGSVPSGSVAVPVASGGLVEAGSVFVLANPDTADGSWPTTPTGASVAVEALHGGPGGNADAGTEFRWLPELTGIEATSETAAGLTGGSFLAGGLRRVVAYKSMDQAGLAELFRASVNDCPAAVLAWASTTPVTGPMASNPGPRVSRLGTTTVLFRHEWLLWLITSQLSSEGERRRSGDAIRDDVLELLHQRCSARDVLRISNEPGIEINQATVKAVSPTSYVDQIRFSTTYAQIQTLGGGNANDWLLTRIRQQTAEQASAVLDIPDVSVEMD